MILSSPMGDGAMKLINHNFMVQHFRQNRIGYIDIL